MFKNNFGNKAEKVDRQKCRNKRSQHERNKCLIRSPFIGNLPQKFEEAIRHDQDIPDEPKKNVQEKECKKNENEGAKDFFIKIPKKNIGEKCRDKCLDEISEFHRKTKGEKAILS